MAGPFYDRPQGRRKTGQIECRRCGVICERVVYPTQCLRTRCRYVYVFEHGASRFFGCVEKVFTVELDLAAYKPASNKDVYGALKAQRPPRPECHAEVEQAYRVQYAWQRCRNPIFLHDPEEYSPEAIRLLVNGPASRDRSSRPPASPPAASAAEPSDSGD